MLSNNRQYLSIIFHKGFNNDYTAIKKWLTDLYNNRNILLGLLQSSRDGANICYGIIGTAISCKDQYDKCRKCGKFYEIFRIKITF